MISNSAKDFAEKHIRPNIMKWDESQYFPREILEKAVRWALRVYLPRKYGGSGLGYHEYVSGVIEEISKADPSIGLSIAAHNFLNGYIFYFEVKNKKKMASKLCFRKAHRCMGSH